MLTDVQILKSKSKSRYSCTFNKPSGFQARKAIMLLSWGLIQMDRVKKGKRGIWRENGWRRCGIGIWGMVVVRGTEPRRWAHRTGISPRPFAKKNAPVIAFAPVYAPTYLNLRRRYGKTNRKTDLRSESTALSSWNLYSCSHTHTHK